MSLTRGGVQGRRDFHTTSPCINPPSPRATAHVVRCTGADQYTLTALQYKLKHVYKEPDLPAGVP